MRKLFVLLLSTSIIASCNVDKNDLTEVDNSDKTAIESNPEEHIVSNDIEDIVEENSTIKSSNKEEESVITNNKEEVEEPYESNNPVPVLNPAIDENTNEDKNDEEPVSDYDFHAYEDYDAFLKKYVSSSGKVNYSAINGDKETLSNIIKEFNNQYPTSDWSYNQKLAFWINTYNIFTIKLIIDNYPTSSITKIASKPWDIKIVKLKGKTYSLDQVENQIIRKKFNEPRIHFALNCASESCPALLNKAYKASTLAYLMTSQTKKFLKDSSKNTYGKKEITISPIFQWYAEDFTKNGGSVIKFINKYRTEQLDKQKIKYSVYSWELND